MALFPLVVGVNFILNGFNPPPSTIVNKLSLSLSPGSLYLALRPFSVISKVT